MQDKFLKTYSIARYTRLNLNNFASSLRWCA